MQNATIGAVEKRENAEPHTLLKRIGSTDYLVSVHFSRTSKERLENKILRLIESEAKTIA